MTRFARSASSPSALRRSLAGRGTRGLIGPAILACSVLVSLSVSARASADEASNDARPAAASSDGDAVYAHRGFFIRPEAGVGYLSSSEPTSAGTIHVSGFAGVAGLALGGAVAENVILAAHVYDAVSVSPSVSLGGESGTSNATLTTLGFGPELDVYMMPSNVFPRSSPRDAAPIPPSASQPLLPTARDRRCAA